MKKLFFKGIIFVTIITGICVLTLFLSMREPFRPVIARLTACEDFMESSEMLPYFEKAREQDGTTQLIIGDSICRQMFAGLSEYNPQTSIQATNAALMIPGQYLLAEEYLQNHPDTTDVFLIMHPLTLTRTFDTEWGYRYAAMTYVETDTLQYLDESTITVMEEVYGPLLLRKEIVWLIEESPICRKLCLSYMNSSRDAYVQSSPFELADLYVKKLYDLCNERGVKLHFYSSPVSEYYRVEMEELAENYDKTWMCSQYPDYLETILYFPNGWTEDMSHFSGEYAQRDSLNEMIRQAYGKTELIQYMDLE